MTETRRALQDLRAKPLEDLVLALAVQLQLDIDQDLVECPDELQQSMYRIAQEALANIADHAQAQNVYVELKRNNGQNWALQTGPRQPSW